MTREARDILGKEIAFIALGMRKRQFRILLSAGDATREEFDEFMDFLRQGFARHPDSESLNADYPAKGGKPE